MFKFPARVDSVAYVSVASRASGGRWHRLGKQVTFSIIRQTDRGVAATMNLPQDTADNTEAGFFRCPVQAEQSKAVIRVGRRKVAATVQETSIDGFTVLVSPRNASKLKVGRLWVLEHDGALIENPVCYRDSRTAGSRQDPCRTPGPRRSGWPCMRAVHGALVET